MNQLADIIVNKLIEKQKEYDEQFHIDIQETMTKTEGTYANYLQKNYYLLKSVGL